MPKKSVNYYNTSFMILSIWKNLDSKHCIYQWLIALILKKMVIIKNNSMSHSNLITKSLNNFSIINNSTKCISALRLYFSIKRFILVCFLLCHTFTWRILKEVNTMNTIKSTIHTEAIFSDDEQHRYLLKKTWNKNKPACTVITMYPHLDGVLSLDLTTVLSSTN